MVKQKHINYNCLVFILLFIKEFELQTFNMNLSATEENKTTLPVWRRSKLKRLKQLIIPNHTIYMLQVIWIKTAGAATSWDQ